jgi:hypothetical protein
MDEIKKTYYLGNIPAHHSIIFKASMKFLGNWDWGDRMYVNLDSVRVGEMAPYYDPSVGNQCLSYYEEKMNDYSFTLSPHYGDTLNVHLITTSTEVISQESWGFNSIEIIVKRCDTICITCRGPSEIDCLSCVEPYYCAGGPCVSCFQNYFFKSQTCLPCDISCGECFNEFKFGCISCVNPDTLAENSCVAPRSIKFYFKFFYTIFLIFILDAYVLTQEFTTSDYDDSKIIGWSINPPCSIPKSKNVWICQVIRRRKRFKFTTLNNKNISKFTPPLCGEN